MIEGMFLRDEIKKKEEMKTEPHYHCPNRQLQLTEEGGGKCPATAATGKVKMEEPDAGVDELLAALGYNVRSSDMAEVAQKLEQFTI